MARILSRKNKKGSWSYTATVRIKGHPSVSSTFDIKGEARAWAAQVEQQIRMKRYRDPRQAMHVTLGDALDRYMNRVSCSKAISTHAREKSLINNLKNRIGQNTPLPEITPTMAAEYRDQRLTEVSAYSVRLELALLSHLFRKAKSEWGLVVDNPVQEIDRPKPPKGRVFFLELEEARRLLDECAASRNNLLHPFVLTLLHSAMRPGEVALIRRRQINLERRFLTLMKTKNDDVRNVPLTTAAAKALSKVCEGKYNDDFVFLKEPPKHDYQKARPAQAFRISFDLARDRAGLKWLHMHDLRHTAASWMLMRGVDTRSIAAILGHRTLIMVMRYTHPNDPHLLESIDKIGDLGL